MPTFVDYLRAGVTISMVAAIDYTASNRAITDPSSLHSLQGVNQYKQALYSVGKVLEPYDADKSFPVYGFGGIPRFMGGNGVEHCFALSGNPAAPQIFGVEAIV